MSSWISALASGTTDIIPLLPNSKYSAASALPTTELFDVCLLSVCHRDDGRRCINLAVASCSCSSSPSALLVKRQLVLDTQTVQLPEEARPPALAGTAHGIELSAWRGPLQQGLCW